jgi:hypothetical protein
LDSGYILKVKPTGFNEWLDVWQWERKIKDELKIFAWNYKKGAAINWNEMAKVEQDWDF